MDKKTLETVQNAKFPDTPEGNILADSQKKIGDITDNFTNPGKISTTKIDLTQMVEDAGLTVQQYESVFGSIKRSEADAVQYVAEQAAAQTVPPQPKPAANSDDKAKRLRLAKAKIMLEKEKRIRLELEEKESA